MGDASSSRTSSSTDRRQRSYTIIEKIRLLNDLKTKYKNNLSAMSRETGIARSVLRGFRENEKKLTTASHKQTSRRLPGGGRKAHFPELESVLYEWVQVERQAKRNVSWTRLRRQGKAIAAELGIAFTGSDKWIHGFMKRNKLVLRVVTHVAQQKLQRNVPRLLVSICLTQWWPRRVFQLVRSTIWTRCLATSIWRARALSHSKVSAP